MGEGYHKQRTDIEMIDMEYEIEAASGGRIKAAAVEAISLCLITLIVPFSVIIDIVILVNRLGERSVTEWGHTLLLAVTSLLFMDAARAEPRARGFYALMAAVFGSALMREMDLWFDTLLYHGSWVLPVIAILGAAGLYAWRYRDTIASGATEYLGRRCYLFILFGMISLVLSRTLGSGRLLWDTLGSGDEFRLFKTIVQESLESYAYLFFIYGAFQLRYFQRSFVKAPT